MIANFRSVLVKNVRTFPLSLVFRFFPKNKCILITERISVCLLRQQQTQYNLFKHEDSLNDAHKYYEIFKPKTFSLDFPLKKFNTFQTN